MKAELLEELAHDMRNSLGVLRSAAHLIARTEDRPQQAAEARRALEEQIAHLATLIDVLANVASTPSLAPAGEQQNMTPAATPGEHRNILIADDNDDAATMLAMILRLEGHVVTIAHDGEQAIEMANASHPDVVLLDIQMPRKNGFEVARELQSRSWSGSCQLIGLSGGATHEDRDRALAAGFSAHFTKPVDIDELSRYLQSSVRSQ